MRVVRALATPVVLLALVAFLIWGALWGYNRLTQPTPVPIVTCVPTTLPTLVASRVTVNVYNGGRTRGAASAVAKQLQAKGFKIDNVGNTDQRITTTVVMGVSATDPATRMVAGFFKGATIKPNGRNDGKVDVYIGTQYGGFNASAANRVAVPNSQACVAAPTTTPSGSGTARPTTTPTR